MVLRGLQEEDEDGREEGPVIHSPSGYMGVYNGAQAGEAVYFDVSVDPDSVLHGFRSCGPLTEVGRVSSRKSFNIPMLGPEDGFCRHKGSRQGIS